MSEQNKFSESSMVVKAISIRTNKIMFEGRDGEEVIKKAEQSGENYILDFETDPGYNFVF